MKVLHIIKTNFGAPWALKQIEKLKLKGIEIVVMLPDDNNGYASDYKNLGITIVPFDAALPVKKPWQLLRLVKEFRQLILDIDPDLIHCHFVTNIMFCRIALRNFSIPRLFQVPGPLHLENVLYKNAEILLANDHDYWAGSCQKTCNIYNSYGINKNRIFFAYYTSDFDQYALNAIRTHKLRKELGFSEEIKLIGTVSYLYKPKKYLLQFYGLKGHEDFIDAMSYVLKDKANVKGIIIGGPAINSEKYYLKMKKRANKKCGDNIIFLGHRNDILEIYPDLDIVVHPSRSENYGGAGESLSMGIPTITTDVGGFPDIIKEGVTGFLVKAGKPVELAEKIKQVLSNYIKAKDIAANGQQFISKINTDFASNQVLEIYHAIQKNYE